MSRKKDFIPTAIERTRREHLAAVLREIERVATDPASELSPAQWLELCPVVGTMVGEIAALDGVWDEKTSGGYIAGIARTLGCDSEDAEKVWREYGAGVQGNAWCFLVSAEFMRCREGRKRRSRPHLPPVVNLFLTLKGWREREIVTAQRLIRLFGREACLSGSVLIGAGVVFERKSEAGTWADTRLKDRAHDLTAAHEFGEAAAGKFFAEQSARARKILH